MNILIRILVLTILISLFLAGCASKSPPPYPYRDLWHDDLDNDRDNDGWYDENDNDSDNDGWYDEIDRNDDNPYDR